jgi:beta-lactam-binding protein with PASTA domain
MRVRKFIWVWWLAGPLTTAAIAQTPLCSTLLLAERVIARAVGSCRDPAPIVDVAPISANPAPAAEIPVVNVIGMSFDAARSQLAPFTVVRSYRSSAEPGGTVLSQQPEPPARLPAGASVRVVLSDGAVRPPPRVPASQIDGIRTPTVAGPVPPPWSAEHARLVAANESPAPAPRADRAVARKTATVAGGGRPEKTRTPNVVAMQNPPPLERSSRGSAPLVVAAETIELPDVVDDGYAAASSALAEFRITRINVAGAAPNGTVLAQEPAPGTPLTPGSTVSLRVSDGSLAADVPLNRPLTARAAIPASLPILTTAAGTEKLPQSSRPGGLLSNTVLTIGAATFLGLVLSTLLARDWLARRQRELDGQTLARVGLAPLDIAATVAPLDDVRFAARLDAGGVTVDFVSSSDPETAAEQSGAGHE